MKRGYFSKPTMWKSFWSALGFHGRLGLGIISIITVGWLGIGPASTLSLDVPWPHAPLWAAIGWARFGWARLPILSLLIFGLMQDIALLAPLGAHGTVIITVFVLAAGIIGYTETHEFVENQIFIPALVLLAGFALYWGVASLSVGNSIAILPIASGYLVTAGLYYFVEPIFDLKDPLA